MKKTTTATTTPPKTPPTKEKTPKRKLRARSKRYRLRSLQSSYTFESAADLCARSVRDAVLAAIVSQELNQRNVLSVLKRIDGIIDAMEPTLLAVVEGGLIASARSTADASLDAT